MNKKATNKQQKKTHHAKKASDVLLPEQSVGSISSTAESFPDFKARQRMDE